MVSVTLQPFYTQKKEIPVLIERRLAGPQSQF
jgi:hypothetical protein